MLKEKKLLSHPEDCSIQILQNIYEHICCSKIVEYHKIKSNCDKYSYISIRCY